MKLANTTCKIECEGQQGTGFFIKSNYLLTSNHVLSKYNQGSNIEVFNCPNQEDSIYAELIGQCSTCDTALLKIVGDYQSDQFLELCNSSIIDEEGWNSYGYSKTNDGQLIGEPLKGEILRYIEDSEITIHDVSIKIENFNPQNVFEGFSGSPVINKYGDVIAIIRFENDKNLSAVSIKKSVPFLTKNNIDIKPDQLDSFELYTKDVFELYPEDRKTDCEAHFTNALYAKDPTKIVNCLGGDLFYPKQNLSVQDIIADLRKDKDLNNSLWKGWIKLLTYIEIIKGNSSDINFIQFNLTEIDLKILYGDNITSNKKISIPLQLSFYFTKEKSYFQIARSFLHIKSNQRNNTCSIFNSNHEHFNTQKFANSNKRKIISDISGSNDSSFKVEEKINFGVLSLEELSSEIVNSESLTEASKNLEKIFLNAIK